MLKQRFELQRFFVVREGEKTNICVQTHGMTSRRSGTRVVLVVCFSGVHRMLRKRRKRNVWSLQALNDKENNNLHDVKSAHELTSAETIGCKSQALKRQRKHSRSNTMLWRGVLR